MKYTPLRRHSTLKPFSRDHHIGLVHANRMMRSADADSVARRSAVGDFVNAWHAELTQHFEDEERLLLGLMSRSDRNRFESEHSRLRALVVEAIHRLADARLDPDWVRQLGQFLHDHICWEERKLFPALQEDAASQLENLEFESQRIEAGRPRAKLKRQGVA